MKSEQIKNIVNNINELIIFQIIELFEQNNVPKVTTEHLESHTPAIFDPFADDTAERMYITEITPTGIMLDNNPPIEWIDINSTQDLIDILEFLEEQIQFAEETTITISWCVEDLEHRAREMELAEAYDNNITDAEEWNESIPQIYDRSKFIATLADIKRRHDCEHGISWGTLDAYLDMSCKLKTKNSKL